jgi:hypothetical protein
MDLFGALLFQVTGQQLSVPRPAGPWPVSRPVRRPSPLLTELSAVDLLSERGEAESLYRESIAHLERTRVRAQLARVHLLYGEWLRHERLRADARQQLPTACDMLDAMGCAGVR